MVGVRAPHNRGWGCGQELDEGNEKPVICFDGIRFGVT